MKDIGRSKGKGFMYHWLLKIVYTTIIFFIRLSVTTVNSLPSLKKEVKPLPNDMCVFCNVILFFYFYYYILLRIILFYFIDTTGLQLLIRGFI